mgnify:FL=1
MSRPVYIRCAGEGVGNSRYTACAQWSAVLSERDGRVESDGGLIELSLTRSRKVIVPLSAAWWLEGDRLHCRAVLGDRVGLDLLTPAACHIAAQAVKEIAPVLDAAAAMALGLPQEPAAVDWMSWTGGGVVNKSRRQPRARLTILRASEL